MNERATTLATIAALISAVVLVGCSNQIYMKERPVVECPDPVVPCLPGSYSETSFDTGTGGNYGYYLVIERVAGLDLDPDEFGVAFASGFGSQRQGLATIRVPDADDRHDEIHRVRFSDPASAQKSGELESYDFARSTGTPAYFEGADTMVLTGKFPTTVRGDYDLISATIRASVEGGDRLTNLKRQPISSLVSWDAQPAFTPDGKTLFFVSSRLSGLGGTDIYVSHLLSDGTWSAPKNFGAAVNTPCDELSPFVSSDGKWLYFSSSGHETVGGYDIFRSRLSGGHPGSPENLGLPINTPADELFPSAPPGASPDTLMYYSSNQRGSNGFDVYVLHRRFHGRPGQVATTEKADTVRLTGVVRYEDGSPVDSATVTLDERDPPRRIDSTTSRRDGTYEFTLQEGKKYDITASKEGKLFGTEEVEYPVYNNRKEVKRDVYFLDTVVFRVNFPFNDASSPYEFTLDDRGFPTDRRWDDVLAQAADVLRRIEPGTGTRIELVGHTDPIGSDAYNLDLGKRRAQFIRDQLVRRGVDPSILQVRSVGESRPLPMFPNEPDEQYRARLRRVELFRK